MSGRVNLYRQIQTRAEGESLYVRYNTDANVVNGHLMNRLAKKVQKVYAEKITVKVYANQQNSV